MKDTYDSIISLGGFCGAAMQLRARGLRPCSMPFDWLFMQDARTVEWMARAVGEDFADFCLKANLEPLVREGVGGLAPFKYTDRASGFGFIHHFWKDRDAGGYEEVRRQIDRRLARFRAAFGPGRSVLLVLATPFGFDLDLAGRLLAAFRARFPEAEVDLHVLQFDVRFADPSTLAARVPDGLPFTGALYARRHGTYDLHRTTAEWAFLDAVSLRGGTRPRPRGLARLRMKVWKSLSKWLLNHGYGVLGVRFDG